MCVEIKMVANGLLEADAFTLEIDRISYWRSKGNALTNKTDGGEGSKGYQCTPELRKYLSKMAKRRRASVETRAKMSETRKKFRWSDEVKAKMSASAKIAQKKRAKKEMRTTAGKNAMREKMTAVSHKGIGTAAYSESKRQAALVRWQRHRANAGLPN